MRPHGAAIVQPAGAFCVAQHFVETSQPSGIFSAAIGFEPDGIDPDMLAIEAADLRERSGRRISAGYDLECLEIIGIFERWRAGFRDVYEHDQTEILSRAVKEIGMRLMPGNRLDAEISGVAVRAISFIAPSRYSSITCISSRARCAPRQKCLP